MLGTKLTRAASRLLLPSVRPIASTTPLASTATAVTTTTTTTTRTISNSASNLRPDTKDKDHPKTAGSYARTDASVTVEYPEAHELPSSAPVKGAGRAGINVKPTLATFSLQGKVGVVTGGARGLGLVMGQGMVVSGADLAIVDLNLDEAREQAAAIVEQFRRENPEAKK